MITGATRPSGNSLDRPAHSAVARRNRHEDPAEPTIHRRAAFESHLSTSTPRLTAPVAMIAPGAVLQLSAAAARAVTMPSHAVTRYLPDAVPRRLGGHGFAV